MCNCATDPASRTTRRLVVSSVLCVIVALLAWRNHTESLQYYFFAPGATIAHHSLVLPARRRAYGTTANILILTFLSALWWAVGAVNLINFFVYENVPAGADSMQTVSCMMEGLLGLLLGGVISRAAYSSLAVVREDAAAELGNDEEKMALRPDEINIEVEVVVRD